MAVVTRDRSSRWRPEERRAGRWIAAFALALYVFTAGGSMATTDAVVTFDVARNLVEHGSVATSGNLLGLEAHRGADGRYYSPFGLAQSIYDIPFYLAGRAIVGLTGFAAGKPDTLPKAIVAMSQTPIGALVAWLTFVLGRLVTGNARAAALAAVTCAAGTLLWPYALFGFGQPLACATLLAGVVCAWTAVAEDRPHRATWAGVWLACALFTRHEMGLAIPIVGAWLFWTDPLRERARRLRAFAVPVSAGIAAWLAFNAYRFGNPIDSGHLRDPVPGFGSPVWEGLLGLLASPSASLFLYSPMAIPGAIGLVRLARRDKAAAVLFGAIVAGFLLLYASLGNWIGGRSYGGRYLVVLLPYLAVGWAVLLSRLRGRALALTFWAVTGVGFVVQVPGVLLDYAKVSQQAAASGLATSAQVQPWEMTTAPLALNTRALPGAVSDNIAYVLGRRTPPSIAAPAGEQDRSFSQQFAFSLDLWWLYLFYMGVFSRLGLAVVAGTLVALTCAIGWRLTASIRALG